jgi:putative nucleotidyltransferase with HDIG domain
MLGTRMKPVSIDEVILKETIPVDLFVQLSEQKYVLIAKAGTTTNPEHLQRNGDYPELVKETLMIAGVSLGPKPITEIQKVGFIDAALKSVFKDIEESGLSEPHVQQAKLINEATVTLVSSHVQLVKLIESMNKFDDETVKHSFMVSVVSSMLGVALDWNRPATLEKLALGGLFHDIGKTKVPAAILRKPLSRLTHDERVIYEGHPEIGAQMLGALKDVPEEVRIIVQEHHELADGTGFPRKLRDLQISPLSRVVAVANAFVDLVFETPSNTSPMTPVKAIEHIELSMSSQFNADVLRAFDRIVVDEKKLAG